MFDKDSFPKSYWTSRLGRQVWWRFCRGQRPRQPSHPHSEETSKKKRDVPRTGRVSFQQGWKLQTSYSESIHCARASSTGEFNYTMYAKWKQILGDLDLCLYSFFFFFFSCALKVQLRWKTRLTFSSLASEQIAEWMLGTGTKWWMVSWSSMIPMQPPISPIFFADPRSCNNGSRANCPTPGVSRIPVHSQRHNWNRNSAY